MPEAISYEPREGEFYPWAHSRVIRRSSDNKRTVVTINTDAKDRHGTIIDPDGGDISNYRNNPVFLINHDHSKVAGNGANVRQQNGQWIAEVSDEDWDLEDEEIAKWHRKVKQGIVRMASIGFMPLEIERIKEEDENGNTERKTVIRKWDMLEFSFTPIGSNPEALVQQRNASLERSNDLKDIRQRLSRIEQVFTSLKDDEVRLSGEQIAKALDEYEDLQQRLFGTASTSNDTDSDNREEDESASAALEYVEPRKHDQQEEQTVYQSPREISDRINEKIKRKQGKA
jgi:hypothetical protein